MCEIEPSGRMPASIEFSIKLLVCVRLKELLQNERVIKYMNSDTFKDAKIPVDTAHCDNILGFSNFTRAVFGMDPNV